MDNIVSNNKVSFGSHIDGMTELFLSIFHQNRVDDLICVETLRDISIELAFASDSYFLSKGGCFLNG